jgi:hypothetical protein
MRIKVDFPSCSDKLPGCAAWPVQRRPGPSADDAEAFEADGGTTAVDAFNAAVAVGGGAAGTTAHADPSNVSAAANSTHAWW